MLPNGTGPQKQHKLETLLGSPALLPEESASRYRELTDQLIRDFAPQHMMQRILIRDIVDLEWDILRWRRHIGKLYATWSHIGLDRLLEAQGVDEEEREHLTQAWARGDRKIIPRIRRMLSKTGYHEPAISVQTFISNIEIFEIFDVKIARAELRRNDALQQLIRFGEELARAVDRARAARERRLNDEYAALGRS